MKTRPILFSGPMVRALLAGRKTQTRRVVRANRSPYGVRGDQLWVKETLVAEPGLGGDVIAYAADGTVTDRLWEWRRTVLPSIHMPRGLSRLTLEVTDVLCRNLQDITEEDAQAEGAFYVQPGADPRLQPGGWVCGDVGGTVEFRYPSAGAAFAALWTEINGERAECAWADNPLVWAISFRRVQ